MLDCEVKMAAYEAGRIEGINSFKNELMNEYVMPFLETDIKMVSVDDIIRIANKLLGDNNE